MPNSAEQNWAAKIADLEFELRRTRLENRERLKEVLYQQLELYDDLQRLLEIAQKQDWPSAATTFVTERFRLIGEKMLQVLLRAGAIQFDSLGQPVNYEYHEVVAERSCSEAQPGTVIEVLSEGYALEGDVLRMAKVVVAKAPE